MSTTPEARDRDGNGRTTAEISKSTLEALDKLQNNDETRDDCIREALRALKEQEPDRLQVDL